MERRRHYWNGSWGRLTRRDILLHEDAGEWWVEERRGGAEGRTRWSPHGDEDAAWDEIRSLLAGTDDWREL